jgi:DNA-binding response OmpR family regulator
MTVLLVSENADLRAAAARVLSREGHHVVTAAHSGHALLAGLECERIDLLISEWELDGGSGEYLAASLRRFHKDVRTIFMANAGKPSRAGVVVRPFTRDDLFREIDALGRVTSLTAF